MAMVMIFLKHEHLSLLGTKLRFTSSFHAETTKQLSGSINPQYVLLDWNQKPSAKKALAPINCHTSALGTQHLHRELAGQHSCVVQPTAFPARHEEEDTALESSPMHTPLIISAGVGPVGAGSAVASLLQKHVGGCHPKFKS